MTEPVYDYLCSIGELIDKLVIENIKCYDANNKIIRERMDSSPNQSLIANLETNARAAGEQRVKLRDEINRRLAEALKRGEIGTANEVRTYTTVRQDA